MATVARSRLRAILAAADGLRERLIPSVILRLATSQASATAFFPAGIQEVVRVPLRAMCFEYIGCNNRETTGKVLSTSDLFKMLWVYARMYTAKMVNLETNIYGRNEMFIGPSMCVDSASSAVSS